MENAFIIKGGNKLKGSIKLSGAKNAALKIIIAALMFKNKVTIKNVPRIKDVEELIHLLTTLGAEVDFHDRHTLEIDGKGLKSNKVDLLHASKIRVSFMLFAPLLHKFSTCYVPNPGGCRIGARPIDRIIDGMKSLGIRIEYDSDTGFYYAQVKSKIQGYYKYPKVTHTGTELLIMLSVLGDDKVILDNTALEPEIDDLIRFLNLAGARIKQLGKKITILPVKELKQKDAFEINSDRNEAVTYASIATASKGEIMLSPIQPEILKTFTAKMKQIGAEVENIGKSLISDIQPDLSRFINNEKILLPVDTVLKDTAIMDAGVKSIEMLKNEINNSKYVLWNGPLGAYEAGYKNATLELARLLALATKKGVKTIVGGGDTLATIAELKLEDSFTFVSTGGGAMLDFLAYGTLPGVEALEREI